MQDVATGIFMEVDLEMGSKFEDVEIDLFPFLGKVTFFF
jgi:hypothetical protein